MSTRTSQCAIASAERASARREYSSASGGKRGGWIGSELKAIESAPDSNNDLSEPRQSCRERLNSEAGTND
jgi:hypothetical protein